MSKIFEEYEQMKGFIKGLQYALHVAQRYKGMDTKNYIGELEETIDRVKFDASSQK